MDGGFDDAISRAFSPKEDYLALRAAGYLHARSHPGRLQTQVEKRVGHQVPSAVSDDARASGGAVGSRGGI